MKLNIRDIERNDIEHIVLVNKELGWHKPASLYERYLKEHLNAERTVLIAEIENKYAGYLTIFWKPTYITFKQSGIPEIVDFSVIPKYRRRGIGTALMDEAENRIVTAGYKGIGIGVGMDPDYGAAQRMYVLRGYIPDGRGLMFDDGRPTQWGQKVTVDDSLALYFTKALGDPRVIDCCEDF